MTAPSVLLNEKEAALLLGLKNPRTLSNWRHEKRYPLRFVKIGSHIRYRRTDIEAFLASRTATGTNPKKFRAAKPKRRRVPKRRRRGAR